MSNWFAAYLQTPTGGLLAAVVDTPESMAAFRALSQEGKPAVQAVAQDVTPIIEALPTKREKDAASQFVGWLVGQMMRQAGYDIVQDRGRVSNAPYKTGAVWQLPPVQPVFTSEAPPVPTHGRLSLRVSFEEEVVASWELTTSETSRITGKPRRVHTVLSPKMPIATAAIEALAYGRRHGYASVWVIDPDRLFPKREWPTA